MRQLTVWICAWLCAAAALAQEDGGVSGPPSSEVRPVVETLHGVEVTDPYRWLEGDNSDASRMGRMTPEVRAWEDAQNAYTRAALDGLPGRASLEARLRELLELGAIGTPRMAGDRVFFSKRAGAQAQPIVYVRENGGRSRTLVDPFLIDESGATSIDWYVPSPDGELMAFGLARGGDEHATLHLLDVDTGEWLADEIGGKTRLTGWLPDGSGFFYTRLEQDDDPYSRVVAFHEVGLHPSRDPVLIRQREVDKLYAGSGVAAERLERLRTTYGPWAWPSDDGRWLVVSYWTGTRTNDLWVADLDAWLRTGELSLSPVRVGARELIRGAALGDDLYLLTFEDAPNGRVMLADPSAPAQENWRELIPQRDGVIIESMSLARGLLVLKTLRDASTTIEVYTTRGALLGEVALPGMGSASISTRSDSREAFVRFHSFDTPSSVFRVNLSEPGAEPTLWERIDVPFDFSRIEVKRATYTSKDGTEIGLFIVHPRGIELNGENPTMLYGYGGFGISVTPRFSATLLPWLERGGVYAVANLRGGGERGSAWHKAGQLGRKQTVFDDFIAAAEWLIEQGYTKPERLGVVGASNGGLLTAAVVTQRPDLVGAAVSAVPVLDMLRYQSFLMGRYWIPEFGTAEDAEQFKFLRAYSPYHRVEPGTRYPAVLITAGANDARVHPMHARKMTALLQAATSADPAESPVLLWVERESGHGRGTPLHVRLRDLVDRRLFMMWQLGMLEQG